MRLADRIAQCRSPFIAQNLTSGALTYLNGASDFATSIAKCQTRYVLSDDLTRLCTAIAYSKGARTLACADLLHVPAELLWVEWCEAPWRSELELYGFRAPPGPIEVSGRRGALVQATRDGRRGSIRTFWSTGESEHDLLASSMEAHFDFDATEEEPIAPDQQSPASIRVADHDGDDDVVRRCFCFRYEPTWAEYYQRAGLTAQQMNGLERHSLGTVAIDIPVMLAFFLLLATRPGLPRRPLMLERLNRIRLKSGKVPLLDQVEVLSPLLPEYRASTGRTPSFGRRGPRLHHVRGHLVRRGSQLFWRVPHLRGNPRAGTVRKRTVTWTIDKPIQNTLAPQQPSR